MDNWYLQISLAHRERTVNVYGTKEQIDEWYDDLMGAFRNTAFRWDNGTTFIKLTEVSSIQKFKDRPNAGIKG